MDTGGAADPADLPVSASESDAEEVIVGYAEVPAPAAVAANRLWWDVEADAYQAEHGAFLAGSSGDPAAADFVWCPEGLREAAAQLLGPADSLRGRRVLEVGCGAAQCARWLVTQGADVVAIDLSAGQLRHALQAVSRDPGPAPLLVQADASALPLADSSIDIACSAFGAIPFVTDSAAVMVEVARVLRPGGRWVFSTNHPMRWCMPDDPGPAGLVVERSYFDRRPYVEVTQQGRAGLRRGPPDDGRSPSRAGRRRIPGPRRRGTGMAGRPHPPVGPVESPREAGSSPAPRSSSPSSSDRRTPTLQCSSTPKWSLLRPAGHHFGVLEPLVLWITSGAGLASRQAWLVNVPIGEELRSLLESQDGVISAAQAFGAGLTRAQIRTLIKSRGWTRPAHGILAAPEPPDPFRASVRGALLACPNAVVSGLTAARVHGLWLLRRWSPEEVPELMIAAGITHRQRGGMRRRSGLHAEEQLAVAGFPVTTLERTLHDLAVRLPLEELVCVMDSALRLGCAITRDTRARSLLPRAQTFADARSESALETLLRVLLALDGLPPESLQHEVLNPDGRTLARLDLSWPSVKLAVEADGKGPHDAPQALYRDRRRSNDLQLLGWTILRFTWTDVTQHRQWVIAQVRAALEHAGMVVNRPG